MLGQVGNCKRKMFIFTITLSQGDNTSLQLPLFYLNQADCI
jgi:hypothetical protein